jgi:hypothetical protein
MYIIELAIKRSLLPAFLIASYAERVDFSFRRWVQYVVNAKTRDLLVFAKSSVEMTAGVQRANVNGLPARKRFGGLFS